MIIKSNFKIVLAVLALALSGLACEKAATITPPPVLAEYSPTPPAVLATEAPQPLVLATPSAPACSPYVDAAQGDAGALNLRAGPGTEYQVVKVLADGQAVTVQASGWLHVRVDIDGQIFDGWVNSEYVVFCK